MKQPVIYLFTHDSVYVGEDGPTHQPVEHVEALRLIPGLKVWRPATPGKRAWPGCRRLRRTDGPCALMSDPPGSARAGGALTSTPEPWPKAGTSSGGNPRHPARAGLIATGSEVSLAWSAADRLAAEGRSVRIVSVPCRELFLEQPEAYRDEVLGGAGARRMTLEIGVGAGWYRLTRPGDMVYSLERYGESGPGGQVAEPSGFSVDRVVEAARRSCRTRPERTRGGPWPRLAPSDLPRSASARRPRGRGQRLRRKARLQVFGRMELLLQQRPQLVMMAHYVVGEIRREIIVHVHFPGFAEFLREPGKNFLLQREMVQRRPAPPPAPFHQTLNRK